MKEYINDSQEESIQDNIPISFNDYFLNIQKELPDFFKDNNKVKNELKIKRFIKENNENKAFFELLPINVINSEGFIEPYSNFINLIHTKPNKISFFTDFEQNEIQLLYLLDNIRLSNEKIEKYKDIDKEDTFTNNHLIKINNIIKSNPDLIGYIYILKWLQKIMTLSFEDYNTNGPLENIIKDKNPISGDTSDPVKIEEICQNESSEEYNNLMKQFAYYLFKGNIAACQEICEERKIEEFSNAFSGGCPFFDKIISCENDFNYFDKDLISPSMYNQDFQEFLDLINKNEYEVEEKNVYGNTLYILWMQVMYENADFSKNGSLLNFLFRLVSGNYKNYDLNNNNIYEYLYINILNLLHSKIFYELTKNPKHKMVQYHYIEPESFKEITQIINNGGRTIFSIIDSIMLNNNYNELCKKHPMLWLELYLIKLFFIKIEIKQENNKDENIKHYLDCLNDILIRMKKWNDFNYLDFDENINNEREFNYSSKNNRKAQQREFYDMINVCLSRAYFSSLINYYNIENKFLENLFDINNLNGEIIEKIFCSFDEVYINYIKNIINLNEKGELDLSLLIYITTYMFDIKSIIFILTEISHYIGTKDKYQEFIDYIIKYFENIKYGQNENLAVYLVGILTQNSNLLSITYNQKHNFNCIDDALNYYVENKLNNIKNNNINFNNENNIIEELSDDDKYKINQISYLFEQNKNNSLNRDTSYSYLLKLFIKFLVNYKYKEAYELKYQLKDYIYDNDALTEDLFYEKISFVEKQIEKINEVSDSDDIQFCTILSCRYLFIVILDCFYFYANKIMLLHNMDLINDFNNKKNTKSKIKKNYFNSELGLNALQFITKKINILNKFIKKIIQNELFYNYTVNYFGEDTKNDFIKLIGDWAFQSIKWVCDIFKMGLVDRTKNDSLHNIYNNMIYDKEIIDANYFLKGVLANDDIINNENRREKIIFEIMNKAQRQKIVEMIYYMAKINRNYLKETFDDKFIKELNDEKNMIIQDLEFDE